MQTVSAIAILIFACLTPIYMYSFFRLYKIVQKERPDWISVRGSLSFFYDGLSRSGDPNVQVEILKIAFGDRAAQLDDPRAKSCARRIKVLLPICLVLFAIGAGGIIANAP
jgi:hypothetical protein